MSRLLLWPVEASTQARGVDMLFVVLVAASALVVILVFGAIVAFAFRYRSGSSAHRERLPEIFSREVEVGWTLATLFAFLALFWWVSASRLIYFHAPTDALNIRVVGKQWMWKIEQPNGAREINTLHLPLGVPVRLSMTSQDVIHSFYVPAFREKQDVLPDRTTTLWFTPSKTGHFALECAEFCGTGHALMTGQVIVMTQQDYAAWSAGHRDRTLASEGARAFTDLGCAACHEGNAQRAPDLAGLFGRTVELQDGRKVVANETYVQRAILDPRADIVKGYLPIMPSYRNILKPGQTGALIAYLRSLKAKGGVQ